MFDRKWSTLEDYLAPFLTCDFVGKTESLKNDLAKAMKLAGENYPLDALLDRDKVNVSRAYVSMDDNDRDLILEKEAGLLAKYYED